MYEDGTGEGDSGGWRRRWKWRWNRMGMEMGMKKEMDGGGNENGGILSLLDIAKTGKDTTHGTSYTTTRCINPF